MGEYQEKIQKHFWMLVCDSIGDIADETAYREKYDPVFKINSKEAVDQLADPLWAKLYSLTKQFHDPNELRAQLDPVVQIDMGKVKDHIWSLLILVASETCDQHIFRENFEPLFRIKSKEAVGLVENHLWRKLYSLTKKISEPNELSQELEPLVQIDVKRAAEAIKEANPEKYKFLQVYK
jgi:hypothetical protein